MSAGGGHNHFLRANQRHLSRELERIKRTLRARKAPDASESPAKEDESTAPEPFEATSDIVARAFGLSRFEHDLLLLCAGVEMDSEIGALCAEFHGHATRRFVTFGLSLAVLDEPHWSALTPVAPLRRFRLLEIDDGAGLSSGRVRIDERILHYLAGVNYIDPRLSPMVHPTTPARIMAPSQIELARSIAAALTDAPHRTVVLSGDDRDGQHDVAAHVARALGRALHTVHSSDLPRTPTELDAFAVLWHREALLLGSALSIECNEEPGSPIATLVERLSGLVFVTAREAPRSIESSVRFEVRKPAAIEQKALWQAALGPAAVRLDGSLDSASSQFRLSARVIVSAGHDLHAELPASEQPDALFWRRCRGVSRVRLDDLARRIESSAGWDDLVLAEPHKSILHQIAVHATEQLRVYEEWGFESKGARGLGLTALFCGESGTGKTMAAEVLANALDLDLFCIDLSSVVSKFIGETERNLRRVFDAAEEGGAILLFDEADALFGKRSEVRDSHDRYANIEVSYLLQRMEAYRGLAILTTNMRAALDTGFQRRLRFVVQFPFPDAREREAIWRGIFPTATPIETLDYARLARLNMSGGNIRSIALNAAFLAAEARVSIGMAHLLQAARYEASKRERPLTDAETRGWV